MRSDPAYAPDAGEPAPRVLMLTARDTIDDRVVGLDEGADDYLVKPFAFTELTARVRHAAASRRRAQRGGAPGRRPRARHGPLRGERGGRLLDLTAKEFALLRYFMTHPGEVLSQEHLLEHVWDEHADPFTNTVRVTVGTLRRKLAGTATGTDGTGAGSTPDQPIETVVGAGYRLQRANERARNGERVGGHRPSRRRYPSGRRRHRLGSA